MTVKIIVFQKRSNNSSNSSNKRSLRPVTFTVMMMRMKKVTMTVKKSERVLRRSLKNLRRRKMSQMLNQKQADDRPQVLMTRMRTGW